MGSVIAGRELNRQLVAFGNPVERIKACEHVGVDR